ncbi:Putative pentatricopeptide repeat-containing protein [Glycine soja]|uniref:Putative pentatricopeptide repeat-containing protein n=1 Tax=Glycine soja TaxID=3848 RepID=A0A0B2PND3_GLYSO|nr:Putative pentatricopeptide repeat-containing protein [Glycine soja]
MRHRDTVSWNTIISAYVSSGDRDTTWKILGAMRRSALAFESCTFGSILKGVARAGELQLGPSVGELTMDTLCSKACQCAITCHGIRLLPVTHELVDNAVDCKIVKHGLELFNTVCNATIMAYSECCSFEDAERVFDGAVQCRDLVAWNSMLGAYLMHEKEDLAFKVFVDMQNFGFEPDAYTYTGIVSACSVQENKTCGKCLHGLVIKSSLDYSVPVSNALITLYIRFNDSMEDAFRIFFSMDLKDCCTWNSILVGCVQGGLSEDALRLFLLMRCLVIEIDHYTFSAVIRSCSDLATLQLGQQVQVLALKVGFDTNNYVGSSLIFMYSKFGIIEDARKSFEATSKDAAIVWNPIIFGYAQHGQGNIALDLFYLMKERKEHFACAIDLYGRAGHLKKAKALVETMPFEADEMVLKNLLGACRFCVDIELASQIAKNLLEPEPEEHCTYVILSEMYGCFKMWDEKASVTRIIRDRGVKKVPGWSWIEAKNKVHAFNAEDHSHPQCEEIYILLQHLKEGIKLFDNFVDQFR